MAGNSSKIWDEVFSDVDLSYSETPVNQNQLFELVKFNFLKTIFPPCHPELVSGSKMLEVGCGAANVSLYFAKRGYQVTCLDFNKNNLEIAKSNFKKENATANFITKQKRACEFIEGNAEKLPFPNDHFDVVCSFGLLEHFKNPQTAISEMARVLKSDGLFFADIVPKRFSCQSLGNLFNFMVSLIYGVVKGKPRQGWEKALRNFRPLYFENSFSWKRYKNFMEQANIKNIRVHGNRPFPRLTLLPLLDGIYTRLLKLNLPLWQRFDRWENPLPLFWGAGWWFWGKKSN